MIFFLALAFSTYATGFLAFMSSHIFSSNHGTVMQWFNEFMKLIIFSQESQALGVVPGAQSLFNILAGIVWMIFIILFIMDLTEAPFDKIIRHKMYPMQAGDINDNFLLTGMAFLFAVFLYMVLIWLATAVLGHLQLDPFYGTVAFIQSLISGNLSGQLSYTFNNSGLM